MYLRVIAIFLLVKFITADFCSETQITGASCDGPNTLTYCVLEDQVYRETVSYHCSHGCVENLKSEGYDYCAAEDCDSVSPANQGICVGAFILEGRSVWNTPESRLAQPALGNLLGNATLTYNDLVDNGWDNNACSGTTSDMETAVSKFVCASAFPKCAGGFPFGTKSIPRDWAKCLKPCEDAWDLFNECAIASPNITINYMRQISAKWLGAIPEETAKSLACWKMCSSCVIQLSFLLLVGIVFLLF